MDGGAIRCQHILVNCFPLGAALFLTSRMYEMSMMEQKSSLDEGNGGMKRGSSFQMMESPGTNTIKLFETGE